MDEQVLRKVTWRLIPFLFLLYICAYLDRVNVSFATLTMKVDLHFSATVEGMGKGIFFLGYFIFEVPSNLIMIRTGARIWIARIMITWGIISAMMMFTNSAWTFYFLRFLLGVAEAGFFPGMIFYLTRWFPAEQRARAVARFMTATAIANVIGGPLSGLLLKLEGAGGLHGWQWLFLIEGIPSVLFGIVVLFYLTDAPHLAHWLTSDERDCLIKRLSRESSHADSPHNVRLAETLGNPRVIHLCALYFFIVVSAYALTMWIPEIIKGLGHLTNLQTGLVTAIPYTVAAISMVLVGTSSDRTRERRKHLAISAFVGAAGLIIAATMKQPVIALVGLTLAAAGQASTMGPFWSLPTSFLAGSSAAAGIAFINSVGNLGGFVGPYVMGWLKDSTGGFLAGLLTFAGFLGGAGILALLAHHDASREIPREDEPIELEIAETETAV